MMGRLIALLVLALYDMDKFFKIIVLSLWTRMLFLCYITECVWALNSAGECHLDVVEVIGSNPIGPIKQVVSKEMTCFFLNSGPSTAYDRRMTERLADFHIDFSQFEIR